MRAVLGRGVTDILPPAKRTMPEALQAAVCHPSTEAALAEVDALLSRGAERAQGRIRLWASIYGLMFFTSDALFRGIRALADRHGTPVAFHIASSREEAALSESRTGKWPIGHLDDIDVLREDMLLTHCTLVTDEEVSRLADRPQVDLDQGHAVADLADHLAHGDIWERSPLSPRPASPPSSAPPTAGGRRCA